MTSNRHWKTVIAVLGVLGNACSSSSGNPKGTGGDARDSGDYSTSTTEKLLERRRSIFGTGRGSRRPLAMDLERHAACLRPSDFHNPVPLARTMRYFARKKGIPCNTKDGIG
jgi:hypothetical protein